MPLWLLITLSPGSSGPYTLTPGTAFTLDPGAGAGIVSVNSTGGVTGAKYNSTSGFVTGVYTGAGGSGTVTVVWTDSTGTSQTSVVAFSTNVLGG